MQACQRPWALWFLPALLLVVKISILGNFGLEHRQSVSDPAWGHQSMSVTGTQTHPNSFVMSIWSASSSQASVSLSLSISLPKGIWLDVHKHVKWWKPPCYHLTLSFWVQVFRAVATGMVICKWARNPCEETVRRTKWWMCSQEGRHALSLYDLPSLTGKDEKPPSQPCSICTGSSHSFSSSHWPDWPGLQLQVAIWGATSEIK